MATKTKTTTPRPPSRQIVSRRATEDGGQYTLTCNHLITLKGEDYKPRITEYACPHCPPV